MYLLREEQGAILGGKVERISGTPQRSSPAAWSITCSPRLGIRRSSASSSSDGVPFVLEAKVRSDGDYGVTVGDGAGGNKLLAVQLTTCENGAQRNKSELLAATQRRRAPSRF